MSHKCHQGSCSTESSGQAHESGKCGCGCGCQNCQCGSHHQKYSDELLNLADKAWMEALKDKIKEQILKQSNEHLTKLAELVAKANHARWNDKIDEKKAVDGFEQQLRELLYHKK